VTMTGEEIERDEQRNAQDSVGKVKAAQQWKEVEEGDSRRLGGI
jgi:hypothetical protein